MSFATTIYAEMCSMFYERVNSHEATVNLDIAISELEDTRKKLLLKYHPDKSADEDADEKFKCIAPAKKQLEKTIKREYNEEKLQNKRDKEEAKHRRNETQARRRNLAMQSANGLRYNAQQLPPTSIETVTKPCPPATEMEVSVPATGVTFTAEEKDATTIPDTSLPPNTVALGIFNGIVCDLNNGTLKVPMNGLKAYERNTITSKKIHPIRMLLKNQLVPVPSDEPDFWTILDMVDKQNIPKSTELHKKLSSAIDFFRELRELNPSLQCTTDNILPDALCDTTVSPLVEETIDSDATPVSSLQEDAPDTPPVQEDALDEPPARDEPPPSDAPQHSRKNSKANKKRTNKRDLELTKMEVTHPVKMQKSNDLMGNTDFVLNLVTGGTITLPNTSKGTPYKLGSIEVYHRQVRKLLNGNVVGITIDLNETNPFRVLDNVLKTHMDVIDKHDVGCNNQLSCGIKLILKLHKQFPQFEF